MSKLIHACGAMAVALVMSGCSTSEGGGLGLGLSLLPSVKLSETSTDKFEQLDDLRTTAEVIRKPSDSGIEEAFVMCQGASSKACKSLAMEWERLTALYETKKLDRGSMYTCDGFCLTLKEIGSVSYEPGDDDLTASETVKVEAASETVSKVYSAAELAFSNAGYLNKVRECRLDSSSACESFVAHNEAYVDHVQSNKIGMSDSGCGSWCQAHKQLKIMLTMPKSQLGEGTVMSVR
jgi:hypothetical protein